jgi:ATP synthase protein I
MVAWQVIAILATAAVFLIQDRRAALAAGLGGGLIVLGTALMALRLFGGGRHVDAGSALAAMIVGMVLKWVVIIAGLYVLLARWQMPGLAVLAGMATAMAVNLMALRFKDKA